MHFFSIAISLISLFGLYLVKGRPDGGVGRGDKNSGLSKFVYLGPLGSQVTLDHNLYIPIAHDIAYLDIRALTSIIFRYSFELLIDFI